ncbi:MAG TPA: BamA/TamA family outer membrane protein, partial [Gemmatimonadales bacterium]
SSRLNYAVSASLRRPGLLGPNSSGLLTVFAERGSEFDVYAREEVGASLNLTREAARRIPLTLGYRLAYGQTFADDANFCAYFNACNQNDVRVLRERRRRGTLTVTLSRLLVNNPLDPSRGSSMGLQFAYSGSLTSSEEFQRFARVIGDAAFYYPLSRNLVLATRVRAGFLTAPTVDFGASGAGRVPYAPPDQRFYAGGPNDVRGFDGNQLGPLVYVFFDSIPDPDTSMVPTGGRTVSPTGGNRLVIGSVELRFPAPIFTGWKMAAFLDAGSVWEDRQTQSVPIRIRATPGVGLRVPTPLGPARVDIAYNPYGLPPGDLYWFASDGRLVRIVPNIQPAKRTRLTFHFAIGQAF